MRSDPADTNVGSRARGRGIGLGLLAALAATLVVTATSVASTGGGGATIASGPAVPNAATLNGNTSTDDLSTATANLGPTTGCPGNGEFWNMSLIDGDAVTLKGVGLAPSAGMYVDIFPAGTKDATLAGTAPVVSAALVTVQIVATKSGVYPIMIGNSPQCGGADGPFNFAILVTHKAVVTLPHLKQIGQAGTFSANVETPDGKPITAPALHLKLYGVFKSSKHAKAAPHLLGSASPSGGKAAFAYKLPASAEGTTVEFQVKGTGIEYAPVLAVTGSFRVAGSA